MSEISVFKGLPPRGHPHVPVDKMDIKAFLDGIKSGVWKNEVEYIRTFQDKATRNEKKKTVTSVTIAGTFSERNEDYLQEHSGFLAVDIDDFTERESLVKDKYTHALFTSISGNGLVVIVKAQKDKHKESYEWLQRYYFAEYGIVVDAAPKNVASLRYVSYDKDLVINEKSIKSKFAAPKKINYKSLPIVLPESQVFDFIKEVIASGKNIAPDYESYMRLAFAIADGLGESGRQAFHGLCRASEKYKVKEADRQYTNALKGGSGGKKITMGTFYFLCKQHGVEPPKGDKKTIVQIAQAKKSGKKQQEIVSDLIQSGGMNENDAANIVTQVYERDDISVHGEGNGADITEALMQWLAANYSMRVNMITRKIMDGENEINDSKINTIYLKARLFFNHKGITKDLVRTIIESDLIPSYDPIKEFIESNEAVKSQGMVDEICNTIISDTPQYKTFVKKWLVSIIAAHKGHPVRSVLALVGGQNTGKTEWFRRLLPNELKSYYAESKLDAGKDDDILMCEKLIVMDDEMGGKSKQDEKRFKELTSKSYFSYRAPYARHNEDRKRLAILCGTSNDTAIVTDPTGNTRILPVNVISIDHEKYNSIDKKNLFMELVCLYEDGFKWQLDADEMKSLADVSSDFETMPFEREMILNHFNTIHDPHSGHVEKMTGTQIKEFIEARSKQKIMNMKRFQIELTSIFGKSKVTKVSGKNIRVYDVVPKMEEGNSNSYTSVTYKQSEIQEDVF
jgi:predicted P-loop ATPase